MKTSWLDLREPAQICYNSIQHISTHMASAEIKDTTILLSHVLQTFAKFIYQDVSVRVSTYNPDFEDYQKDIETIHISVKTHSVEISFSELFFSEALGGLVLHRLLAPLTPLIVAMSIRPDMSFCLYCGLGDDSDCADYAACSAHDTVLLYPDPVFFYSGGYEHFNAAAQARWVDWYDRKNAVIWRGSTTGRRRYDPRVVKTNEDDVTWLPRLDLCSRFQVGPLSNVSDVGISAIVQMEDKSLFDRANKSFLIKSRVEQIEFINYRYLIDIDGNSNAWSNMFCSMLLGGCIYKIDSENKFTQWYYKKLTRGVHFIPVESDFSNLEEVVLWGLRNTDETKRIAEAAGELVKKITFEKSLVETALAIVSKYA